MCPYQNRPTPRIQGITTPELSTQHLPILFKTVSVIRILSSFCILLMGTSLSNLIYILQ